MSLNAEILSWARQKAGFSVEDAVQAINLGDARGVAGEDRLLAFERGEDVPSKALLRRMAKQYRRPLLTFYLSKIPEDSKTGHDFRTLHDFDAREDSYLSALLREIKARQSLVRDLLTDDDQKPLDFVGSLNTEIAIAAAAEIIMDRLNFDRQHFQGHNQGVAGAFSYLRSCVEEAGIFVLLASNLGSWQTTISVNVFRGFAIADPIAPFVVINDQDARTAWAFTLLHECVHLWLGQSGVSGSVLEGSDVERYCNRVAARILLEPEDLAVLDIGAMASLDQKARLISDFAEARNLGRSMVAFQSYQVGLLNQDEFGDIFRTFAAQWRAMKSAAKERNRESDGGPNYYVVKRHRLGERLLGVVRSALSDGAISPTRASRMLGVKPTSVYQLMYPPLRRAEP